MVSSRRISRAGFKVKYQGKRRAGRKRSGRCTTNYHEAGFGEAALTNVYNGKAYLLF